MHKKYLNDEVISLGMFGKEVLYFLLSVANISILCHWMNRQPQYRHLFREVLPNSFLSAKQWLSYKCRSEGNSSVGVWEGKKKLHQLTIVKIIIINLCAAQRSWALCWKDIWRFCVCCFNRNQRSCYIFFSGFILPTIDVGMCVEKN